MTIQRHLLKVNKFEDGGVFFFIRSTVFTKCQYKYE